MTINPYKSRIELLSVIFNTVTVKPVTAMTGYRLDRLSVWPVIGMTGYRFTTVNRGPVIVFDRWNGNGETVFDRYRCIPTFYTYTQKNLQLCSQL